MANARPPPAQMYPPQPTLQQMLLHVSASRRDFQLPLDDRAAQSLAVFHQNPAIQLAVLASIELMPEPIRRTSSNIIIWVIKESQAHRREHPNDPFRVLDLRQKNPAGRYSFTAPQDLANASGVFRAARGPAARELAAQGPSTKGPSTPPQPPPGSRPSSTARPATWRVPDAATHADGPSSPAARSPRFDSAQAAPPPPAMTAAPGAAIGGNGPSSRPAARCLFGTARVVPLATAAGAAAAAQPATSRLSGTASQERVSLEEAAGALAFNRRLLLEAIMGREWERMVDHALVARLRSCKRLEDTVVPLCERARRQREAAFFTNMARGMEPPDGRPRHVYPKILVTPKGMEETQLYTEPGNTVAHRELGNQLLKVVFEERGGGGRSLGRGKVFPGIEDILERGFRFAGRDYVFFCFKEAENVKENHLFFVCLRSAASQDIGDDNFRFFDSVSQVYWLFGHFETCGTVNKVSKRSSLIFSRTLLALDLSEYKHAIEVIEDIETQDKGIATDGAGLIHIDLARKIPFRDVYNGVCFDGRPLRTNFEIKNPGDVPVVLQIRLYCHGLVAKGTLLVVTKMPTYCRHGTKIVLRESMVKVKASLEAVPSPLCQLELVSTNRSSRKFAGMGHELLNLLCAGGVDPDFFLALKEADLNRASAGDSTDVQEAIATFTRAIFGNERSPYARAKRMLLVGCSLREGYIQRKLAECHKKEEFSTKVVVPYVYSMIGVADPTGTLAEDEVMVFRDDLAECGDVLVTRSPASLIENIRSLRAVDSREVRRALPPCARNCIIFPTRPDLPRSVPEMMAAGDLDGDLFLVILNPAIVHSFRKQRPPPRGPPVDEASFDAPEVPRDPQRLLSLLKRHYVDLRTDTRNITGSANYLAQRYFDHNGPYDEKGRQCAFLKERALVAPKTGDKVEIPLRLQNAPLLPHFLASPSELHYTEGVGLVPNGLNIRRSESVAGKLCDLVAAHQHRRAAEQRGGGEGGEVQGRWIDPDIVTFPEGCEITEEIRADTRLAWDHYLREMKRLQKRFAEGDRNLPIGLFQDSFYQEFVLQGFCRTPENPVFPLAVRQRAAAMYMLDPDRTFAWDVAHEPLIEIKIRKSGCARLAIAGVGAAGAPGGGGGAYDDEALDDVDVSAHSVVDET